MEPQRDQPLSKERVRTLLFTPHDDQVVEDADEGEGPVDALLRLTSSARLYRSTDGRLQARVKVGDRHEIHGLNSPRFRGWLINEYLVDRREPPSRRAMRAQLCLWPVPRPLFAECNRQTPSRRSARPI
jgi:hypothetical protein